MCFAGIEPWFVNAVDVICIFPSDVAREDTKTRRAAATGAVNISSLIALFPFLSRNHRFEHRDRHAAEIAMPKGLVGFLLQIFVSQSDTSPTMRSHDGDTKSVF